MFGVHMPSKLRHTMLPDDIQDDLEFVLRGDDAIPVQSELEQEWLNSACDDQARAATQQRADKLAKLVAHFHTLTDSKEGQDAIQRIGSVWHNTQLLSNVTFFFRGFDIDVPRYRARYLTMLRATQLMFLWMRASHHVLVIFSFFNYFFKKKKKTFIIYRLREKLFIIKHSLDDSHT